MKKITIFLFVLVLAFILRFYQIDQIPPSLNWDEVSHGYNAYSLLTTGKDEWGASFPMIFRAYGDYKLPLYIYLTAISIFSFGLNELSVRLVSMISGIILVLTAYFITQKMTKDSKISLMAAFLTAISPWSLFLSRVALEANLCAALVSLGIYTFLLWLDNTKAKYVFLTAILWGLAMNAYNSARIVIPVLALTLIIMLLRKKYFKQFLLFVFVLFLFLIPVVSQIMDKSGSARLELVSLIDQGVVNKIIEQRAISKLPEPLPRILFNRFSYFIAYSAKNYFANLSPEYLFIKGGTNYQFSQPGYGLLFLITAPFLLLGLLKLLVANNVKAKLILFWLFLAIIPSAITKDAPHALRTALILPAPMLLIALGWEWVYLKIKNNKIITWIFFLLFLGIVLFSFSRWWLDYQYSYAKKYSWAWQYGYKEMVYTIRQNYSQYDKIIITKKYGEPQEFILFWLAWDSNKLQNDPNLVRYYKTDWYWTDSFDKFIFINDWEMKQNVKCQMTNDKCLLVTSPGNYPEGWNLIKTINFLDKKTAFEILEK